MIGIIYKATNIINGNCYIGKTLISLARRKAQHKYCAFRKNSHQHFHNAIRKYGFNSFQWEILQRTKDHAELIDLEKYFIKFYKTKIKLYNKTDGGDGVPGYRHTEETKKRHSLKLKGRTHITSDEHKKNISKALTGRKFSAEHIMHLVESHKGQKPATSFKKGHIPWNKNKPWSPETLKKLSESHKGQKGYWTGKKLSKEHCEKLSISHMGHKPTAEVLRKKSESLRQSWALRKNQRSA